MLQGIKIKLYNNSTICSINFHLVVQIYFVGTSGILNAPSLFLLKIVQEMFQLQVNKNFNVEF